MKLKNIRWQQRFENYQKAVLELEEAVLKNPLSKLERAGLIKNFEFTFELAWKTMKDFIEVEGISVNTPRDTIKYAFQIQIITHGEIWLEALDNRNLLTHTYSENLSISAENKIKKSYFPLLKELQANLKTRLP